MELLMIDPSTQKEIEKIVAYASTHRQTPEDVVAIMNGTQPPLVENANHVIRIPTNFVCIYSETIVNGEIFYQLTVGTSDKESAPHPIAVSFLLMAFGFECADILKKTPNMTVHLDGTLLRIVEERPSRGKLH